MAAVVLLLVLVLPIVVLRPYLAEVSRADGAVVGSGGRVMPGVDDEALAAFCAACCLLSLPTAHELSQVNSTVGGKATLKSRVVGDDFLDQQIYPCPCRRKENLHRALKPSHYSQRTYEDISGL